MLINTSDFVSHARGNETEDDDVGGNELGERHERGEKRVEWARTHMIIEYTCFQQHAGHLCIRKSPGNRYRKFHYSGLGLSCPVVTYTLTVSVRWLINRFGQAT